MPEGMENYNKKEESANQTGSYSARRKKDSTSKESRGLGKTVAGATTKALANKIAPGIGGAVVDKLQNQKSNSSPSKTPQPKAGPSARIHGKNASSGSLISNHPLINKGAKLVTPLGAKTHASLPGSSFSESQKSEEAEEEAVDEFENEQQKRRSSRPDFLGLRSGRRKDGSTTSGIADVSFKAFLKRSYPILIPVAVILFSVFLLFPVILLMNDNNFGPVLGANTKTGGETDDIEYEGLDEEEEAFYQRIEQITKEYNGQNQQIKPDFIAATYFIMQTYDENLTFEKMDEGVIKSIANAMLEDGTYSEDAFKNNLKTTVFPSMLPSVSHDRYDSIVEEIFEYMEDFKDLLEIQDVTPSPEEGNTQYWWPIGSLETSEESGVVFAKGNPTSTEIRSYFAGRIHPITKELSHHKGVDLTGANPTAGVENVIAALDGTVVFPSTTATSCESFGDTNCGGGYGNYIVIQHADGNYTLYAHLHQNTITVKAGETVKQGQVIAKMGSSGMSTGTHLHFEVRVGSNASSSVVDPLNYIDPNNPRPVSIGSVWSLTKSAFSKEEFVAKMKAYCDRTKISAFCNNFAAHAETIYDTAHSVGVNPELIVATAGTEQRWEKTCGYNFYGIGIGNGQGCSSGAQYASLEAGIRGFGDVVASYNPGGHYASAIEKRYNERKAAGCDPAGYGKPGTLQGMQSVYSWLGDYRYNPGSWGKGGCVYLKIMYPNYPYCKPSTAALDNITPTTVCEQNDYTAYQLKEKYKIRQDIFGL